MAKGKILAVDYGQSSIGLALSDEGQLMAFGRGTLALKKGLKDVFAQISRLCADEKVVELVVGLPLDGEGKDTVQTLLVRKFARKLEDFLHGFPEMSSLRIAFQDESFSSFEADQFLAKMGVKPKNRKHNEDELAAIFILQRFLLNL